MNYISRLLVASVEFPLLLPLETEARVSRALADLTPKRVFAFTRIVLEWELCPGMALGFPLGPGKGSAWNSKEGILALCHAGGTDARPCLLAHVWGQLHTFKNGGGGKEDYIFSKLNSVKYLNSSVHLAYENKV